jgi:hypothetical protein
MSDLKNDSDDDDLEVIDLLAEEPILRPEPEPEPEAGDEDRPPRRRRLLVLAIAAVAAIAGVSVAVVSRDDGDAKAQPANPSTSNASRAAPDAVPTSATIPANETLPPTSAGDSTTTAPLLPEGAPSTPLTGELVASVASQTGGVYYLYADGRLIQSSGQPDVWGGMVEQRLTPEGVERVRAEFLAAAQLTSTSLATADECWGGGACVRGVDGRVVRILPGPVSPATPASTAEARLVSYLSTLASSLPKTAWADRRIKTYVASRIRVCIGTYADLPDRAIPVQIDLAAVLPAFPAGAAELFAGREAHGGGPPCVYSVEMTLEEARALADIFFSATGGGAHEYGGIVVRNEELATIPSDRSAGIVAYITFGPLLPNERLVG